MGLVISSFRRSVSGFIFADFFNRPNSNDLGNDWTEIEPGGSGNQVIEFGELHYLMNFQAFAWREPPVALSPLPSSLLIQMNIRNPSSDDNAGVIIRSDIGTEGSGSESHYLFDLYQLNDKLRLFKVLNGITTEQWEVDAAHSTLSWHGIRLTLVPENGATRLKTYWHPSALPGGDPSENLTEDFTAMDSQLDDVSPLPLTNEQFGVKGYSAGQGDSLMLTGGPNITVKGVPSGWKVKIDSRASVVSTGVDVVIDASLWAMPMGAIRILDDADVEQAILVPNTPPELPTASGGIFPGDTFEVAVVTDIVYSACEAAGSMAWVKEA